VKAKTKTRKRFAARQDTRTGVAILEYRYDVPFKFTVKIDKLTFKLEPEDTKAKP
jgi:arylsulfatase